MLEVSIKKNFGTFTLQSSFNAENEILGILGPSGSGKSLTLRCIAGLQTPDEGRISINGAVVFDSHKGVTISPKLRNIGFVFQNYALFPHLTVAQNIGFGLNKIESKIKKKLVAKMIEKVHLEGYDKHYPEQISGGQQQRVALARTLVTKPELLLLDEPFSALDNHVKSLLEQELLHIIKKNFAGTVLLVTHNIEEAYRLCSRILVFSKGENIQMGNKQDVINSPASLDVARLTGCKNFIETEIVAEDQFFYTLKNNNLILKAIKQKAYLSSKVMAGIRAHHIMISSKSNNKENCFRCKVLECLEGVFYATVLVNCFDHILQVEISKDHGQLYKASNEEVFLYIPPENIFLVPLVDE